MQKPYDEFCCKQLASIMAATGKPKLVLCFKHYAQEQVPLSRYFNIDCVP